MSWAKFKKKRTAAASRGFLAIARFSCYSAGNSILTVAAFCTPSLWL